VRTKGEGSVKSNAEELGSGVKCEGDASQSELGLRCGLMGSMLKKQQSHLARLTGRHYFRDFMVIKSFLNRVGSFQRGKTRWRDHQHM